MPRGENVTVECAENGWIITAGSRVWVAMDPSVLGGIVAAWGADALVTQTASAPPLPAAVPPATVQAPHRQDALDLAGFGLTAGERLPGV